MAEHGYAREYDEPIDRADDDRGRWRSENRDQNRNWDWRGSGGEWSRRDQGWRDAQDRADEHHSNFMFGEPDYLAERGHRSDTDQRPSQAWDSSGRDMADRWRRDSDLGAERHNARRIVTSHQDDHYRSWRDRQMAELDRDYADYCREREQQFHRDFDDWRSKRQANDRSDHDQGNDQVLELNHPAESSEAHSLPDPTANATLGTSNNENSEGGRS